MSGIQDSDAARPVTVTREELHAQVWQTPMSRLAAQYGITGNGLAKICDRLKIPYPPRGHWAKNASGKKVVTYRLPTAAAEVPLTVIITPTSLRSKELDLPEEVRVKVDAARLEASTLVVPERLFRPHQIVAAWLADRESQKQKARHERDPWRKKLYDPGEFTASDKRQHRILDTLFKALEQQGAKMKQSDRHELYAELLGEKVEFQLREKQKQIRRPPTDDEKKYSWNRDRGWVQEMQPSGKLLFAFKTYLPDGLKREWLETESKTLEGFLPDIIATFIAAGPLLVKRRREREEAERQRQIAEQKKYEKQQRLKREDNRWRRFVDFANSWNEIENAQAFLAALRGKEFPDGTIDGKTISEWIVWAEDNLRDRNPLELGSETIFGTIAAINEWNYGD